MRVKLLKIILMPIFFCMALNSCGGSSPSPSPSPTGIYTITWKNDDGSILANEDYKYGETPSYKGETPTKPSTSQYSYTFSSWTPALEKVTCNKTYTATFTKALFKYDIKWYNGTTLLKTDSIEYGKTPIYTGDTPTKASTDQYSYTFSGWSPTITPVTGSAEYHAQFTESLRKYVVTFNSNGGTFVSNQTIEYGKYASEPNPPTKSAPLEDVYVFDGWYIDDATFKSKFVFTTMQITKNTTLYAKWIYISKALSDFDFSTDKSTLTITLEKYKGSNKSINIPSTVLYDGKTYTIKKIADSAFKDNLTLESITIPNTIIYIGHNAFNKCRSLRKIYFEENSNLEKIDDDAFSACDSLEEFNIPKKVSYIGEGAFAESIMLKSITIPSSLTFLGQLCFYSCDNLTNVLFDENSKLNSIQTMTFSHCKSLSSINIPNSVTSIDYGAFEACLSLSSVTLPKNLTVIESHLFSECTSLKSIVIPENVTRICENAFNMTSVANIIIHNNITRIDNGAFSFTSLMSITIPSSVKTMGPDVFSGCDQLDHIYCQAESEPETWNSFWKRGCNAEVTWGASPATNVF